MKNTIGVKKRGFSEAVTQLLEALAKEDTRVSKCLIKRYQELPVSPTVEEWAYNYFIAHSVITAATVANPGSSMTTEFLYEGLHSPSSLDNYLLRSKAGQAVKARLTAIEKELPKIIEKYRNKGGEVLIGNLGSGPGRDVIDTFYYYRDISNVRAIHIDKDGKALERGKRMAIAKGVDHLIEFVQADFLRYKPTKKFDIAFLIGVICPLDIETCITYLKIIKRLLKPEGCLIASNASKRMLEEDPFTCFLMEWTANWKLVHKDEKEIKQIFEKAGYLWEGCFTDSFGFHIMGIGIPCFFT